MVYGVSRIALPSSDWGDSLRASGATQPAAEFVTGTENRLAVPALERLLTGHALSVAAELFNPLVLLGASGTGKSQLARGIVRHWSSLLGSSETGASETGASEIDQPEWGAAGVAYFTAVDFARQVRAAREENQLDQCRDRLAELQLLVVEDLRRLPASRYVQRELRDTLDILLDAGAVVIVTAQRSPATMAHLEAGLRDRLAAGLTVRLQLPGVEARYELLKQAAAARQSLLSDHQLRSLAQKTEGSAPQLMRALAEHELGADQPGLVETVRPPLKIKQIIAVVARYYALTQAAICSSARRKSLVYARSVAIYLARSLTELSYAQIGHSLGRRDHTTIMHACRSIEARLASDATTQQDIEELKRILTAV
ncbi:MAG: helix-turn-helix domain-containing protein [Bythopirellula sp.]